MRAVRCEVCGARAMTAAAQCPTCGHHLELRDPSGELLPLAYCSSCQSYYPESLGECKWCGTKPERAPIGPHIWKGIGVAALVIVVGTGYLLRHDEPLDGATRRTKATKSHSTQRAADTVPPPTMIAVADTTTSSSVIANPESVAGDTVTRVTTMSGVAVASPPPSVQIVPSSASPGPPVESPMTRAVPVASIPRAASTAPIPRASTPRATPAASTTRAPSVASTKRGSSAPSSTRASSGAPTSRASSAAAKARRPTRWVSSVSRDWVVVRADASKRSRLVASIGPNSRVQLGESRGDWRRIRAKGLSGWVEQRAEFRTLATGDPPALATRARR